MNRKEIFSNGEIYHIFNRGVDKRSIFSDMKDVDRFMQSLVFFNTTSPCGGFKAVSDCKDIQDRHDQDKPLVKILGYSLLENHFHLLIKQVQEDGVSKFMHRLGGGYTGYYNLAHNRSGSLFQGKFKSIHINNSEYLTHATAYVHANNLVHNFKGWKIDKHIVPITSLSEYAGTSPYNICDSFYNPLGDSNDSFAQWCAEWAAQIRQDRLEFPWMFE